MAFGRIWCICAVCWAALHGEVPCNDCRLWKVAPGKWRPEACTSDGVDVDGVGRVFLQMVFIVRLWYTLSELIQHVCLSSWWYFIQLIFRVHWFIHVDMLLKVIDSSIFSLIKLDGLEAGVVVVRFMQRPSVASGAICKPGLFCELSYVYCSF